MKIVVIDDVLMNEEQIERLKSMGDLKIFSGAPANRAEIIDRAEDADVIISGWTYFNNDILDELKNLKMISLWATGTDYIDISEAHKRGIAVTNVPGYARNAVAELALCLMLSVIRKVPQADRDVRNSGEYHWSLFQGMEISDKTLGILGTGAIGCRMAEIAKGFNMKVIAFDPYPREENVKKYNIKYVSYEDIFIESDIVTVHMPLLPSTRHLITLKDLDKMKKDAVFINTARADLVNQDDLYQVLKSGRIFGAGLDDINFSLQSGADLLALDNVVVTPHMGFNTREATIIKTNICIDNISSFLNGQLSNRV